ncbi:hypothetical protein HZB00_00425 [Candidatus Woesearchaeota archaeon]|nr:hypothetical protein [Candidatus Woesearchaeota archaeon]
MAKYCTTCKIAFPLEQRYCDQCGKRLEIKPGSVPVSPAFSFWMFPWIVLAGVLLFGTILLLPTKQISYTAQVPYIAVENYTLQIPYEDLEEYKMQVPYTAQEPFVESVPVTKQAPLRYLDQGVTCTANGESTAQVTNVDTDQGVFTVIIGYINQTGAFVSTTISKTIDPKANAYFTYSPTPSAFQSCRYYLDPLPIKTTVDYKDVIKQRDVTQYREETKYRKVTKLRNETREHEVRKIKEEARQKEVNWIFGFDAFVKFRK